MIFNIKYKLFIFFLKIATNSFFFKKFLNYCRKFVSLFLPVYESSNSNEFKRIYHYHVPKTSGTSINAAFYESENLNYVPAIRKQFSNLFTRSIKINGKVFSDHNISLINKSAFYYSWSHYPLEDLDFKTDTYTFTSLREPGERIVSYYRFLDDINKFKKDDNYKHMVHLLKNYKERFDEFIYYLPENIKYAQLNMFSKKLDVDEAIENIKKVNHIIVDNNFEPFIKEIDSIFNTSLTLNKINKTVSKKEIDISILKDELKKEYRFYDYILKNVDSSGKLQD